MQYTPIPTIDELAERSHQPLSLYKEHHESKLTKRGQSDL